MSEVVESVDLQAPTEEVWALLGQFGSFADWHPAGTAATVETTGEGTVRTVTIAGGERLIERLVSEDPAGMSLTYAWIEGALPVESMESTLTVSPREEGSTVTWRVEFQAAKGEKSKAADVIDGLVASGLQGLKKRFK